MKRINLNKLIIGAFLIFSFSLLFYLYKTPPIKYGGDMLEYFGMTESIIKNKTIFLTKDAQKALEPLFGTESFNDPLYYLKGRDSNKYPVHFFFYSVLATPIRLFLRFLNLNELNTFRFLNFFILSFSSFYILLKKLKTPFQKVLFIALLYTSPLIWFIVWPGPDIYYVSLLLISTFFFFERKYFTSSLLIALSSWHSQPLIILSLGILAFNFFRLISTSPILSSLIVIFTLVVPYLYNYYAFSLLTPWTIFKDGWTQLFGFGMQNVSIQRLFEQFFDLNIGLFWYAPILFLLGFFFFIKRLNRNKEFLVFLILILTALFYQTNPGWNYGTSGYGPTRHILFLIPILIYFAATFSKPSLKHVVTGVFLILTQGYIMSFNGFLTPNFMNSYNHTPYAKYVLSNFPSLYNPTPEIFIDRTNHTYFKYPTTAIYKTGDKCKKAYVIKPDLKRVEKECGDTLQKLNIGQENDLEKKVNYKRTVVTREATFWADPTSCESKTSQFQSYICVKKPSDALNYLGVDVKRLEKIKEYDGAWKLIWGDPVIINIPPGYFINHYSLEGTYVNF